MPHLLLFALAAALVGHLWMLHGAEGHASMASTASVAPAGAVAAAATASPAMDVELHVMALGCLAVLGVCAAFFAAGRRVVGPPARLVGAPADAPAIVRRSLWPPPSPGEQRVQTGILLLV
jgi:hypothetical protein